jgi:L-threonylcarbamoyladenylate synthase
MSVNSSSLIQIADVDAVASAAALIRAGDLVAFPTETVYGLGADATNDAAVAAIFAAKGRPRFNPLIAHFATPGAALGAVESNRLAETLAEAFWPGPLTLILPRKADSSVSLLLSAGLDTLAVRVPDNRVALDLIESAGRPIAAPSANRSEHVSPTTAEHVAQSLGDRVAVILDGGACPVGVESTVLDLRGTRPVLLRPGGASRERIEAIVGPIALSDGKEEAPRSPGMGRRHYAPGRPVRLHAQTAAPQEALLAFGPHVPENAPAHTLNLSQSGDVNEAAANLFAMMRALDRPDVSAIAVMSVPETGLGQAINDRLRRAAKAKKEA